MRNLLNSGCGGLLPAELVISVSALRNNGSPHLMGSAYQIQVVFVQELGHHFGSESERDSPVILSPAQHIFVRIGPQEVTQQALVWHIGGAHDPADLLHGLEVGREAWRKSTWQGIEEWRDGGV